MSANDLINPVTRENKIPITAIREKITRFMKMKSPPNDSTATMGNDNDNQRDNLPHLARQFYNQIRDPNFLDRKYHKDISAMYNATKALVQNYTAIVLKGNNPAFPFKTITKPSKTFADNNAKITDMESHVGGTVSKRLLPYFSDKHPNTIKTLDTLLAHLKKNYLNINAADKAKAEWQKLALAKYGIAKFSTFKSEFVRLAEYLKKDSTFDAYTKHCSQVAHHLCSINQKRDAARKEKKKEKKAAPANNNQGNFRTPRNNTTPSGATGGSGAAAAAKRLTPDKMKKLIIKGKCFNCKQPGYITRDYPLGYALPADHEARVAAIMARFSSTPTLSTEENDTSEEGKE
ncbi:hypothetical protein CHU98_g8561 [Xylaria longipes]|nr:hypothetical protein CHU98_g8561 [Xylaria longipes]